MTEDSKLPSYRRRVPAKAVESASYEGTEKQVEQLRERLRSLNKGIRGGNSVGLKMILIEAGLNVSGSITYDQSALQRFINGETKGINVPVARALYQRWVEPLSLDIDLCHMEDIFYHGTMIAFDAVPQIQWEIGKKLSGFYLFYKRSALNPDFFVKGLLRIVHNRHAIHVRETQYHKGGGGMPEMREVDQGYAVVKGGILYFMTRSNALKGATFTVMNNFPVKVVTRNEIVDGKTITRTSEEIAALYGFQIGGRESTPPTSSAFAAQRISNDEGSRIDKTSEGLELSKTVPELLARHLGVSM